MGNIILTAVSLNNVIGLNNRLPWKVPKELSYFKKTTLEKMIVMGRKTAESTGLLPRRLNVVLTFNVRPDQKDFKPDRNPHYISNIEELLHLKEKLNYEDDVYIIGGEQIYDLFLRQKAKETKISKILLSRIPQECAGDTYFPQIPDNFKLVTIIEKEGFSVEEYINEES